VKFTVTFRGREMAHTDAGFRLLDKVVKDLEDVGQVENPARLEGRNLVLLMVPRSAVVKSPAAPAAKSPAASGRTTAAAAGRAPERKPSPAATKSPSTQGAAAGKPPAPRS
jgi:hypothetical protein